MPLVVAISEDATRILSKVEYDIQTNELVGLVAPYDENGVPVKSVFPASSASVIVKHFMGHKKASNVIAISAQPIKEGMKLILFVISNTN